MSLSVCLACAFHHCNRTVVLTLCTSLDNQEAGSFQIPKALTDLDSTFLGTPGRFGLVGIFSRAN
jgi:hypothetical protein